MLKKLRIRFVCITMAIVLVAMSIIFGLILQSTRKNLQQDSAILSAQLLEMPYLTVALGQHNGLSFFIFDLYFNGNIHVVNTGGHNFPVASELQDMANAMGTTTEGTLEHYHLRYTSAPMDNGIRYVFVDTSREEAVMANLGTNLLEIGGISLLVFFGLSLLLSNWAMAPVRIAWAEQKRFISDASHELKTPITIISANADMICKEPERQHVQRMEHIQSSAERLLTLTNGLLQLARADMPQQRQEMTTVDMSKLLEMEALSFEALFFEKSMSMTYTIPPNITLSGQETTLRQLVCIFLDNAYKYGTPHTNVHIELRHLHRIQWIVGISNHGDTIDTEHLDTIFRRFYRMDNSRGQVEGYGLGLSIAAVIAQSHGGKVWADSTDGINTFYFQFFSNF